jgi:hypothetical protein
MNDSPVQVFLFVFLLNYSSALTVREFLRLLHSNSNGAEVVSSRGGGRNQALLSSTSTDFLLVPILEILSYFVLHLDPLRSY